MFNKKQKLKVFVSLFVVFSLLFAFVFISLESNHDCTGEDCQICAYIHSFGNLLKKLVLSVFSVFVTVYLGEFIAFFNHRAEKIFSYTLISLKVKLLN